jgi:hypothetical protein
MSRRLLTGATWATARRGVAGLALVGFLTGLGAGTVLGPRHTLSTLDGRTLVAFPHPSTASLADGTWMTGVESWLNDHIPGRTRWLSLHGQLSTKAMRAPVVDDVLVDDPDGMQLEKPVPLKVPPALATNAARLGHDVRATGTPILWVYVPRKEEAFADRLPPAWHNYLLDARPAVLSAMSAGGPLLDLTPTLSDPARRDELYWRTDHHWTPAGALAGIDAISTKARSMGIDIPADDRRYETRTYPDYYGSTGRRVTAGATRLPDRFTVPAPPTWRARSCVGAICDRATFAVGAATAKDRYAPRYKAFMGGDHGYQRIENPDPAARGTIVLLKDSFGDALSTYLAERVKTLITIDERHYRGKDIRDLVAQRHPDLVIVMHNQVSMLGNKKFDSESWVDVAATAERLKGAPDGDG